MLYIFDLGNVIVDIDFRRVLGVWSNLSGVPLASLSASFSMGEAFHRHERGEISDEEFAVQLCNEMGIALSFEQFSAGWQAVFVGLRKDTLAIMERLRNAGHRVVVLSNTNRLHSTYWPEQYPEVRAAADAIYLSQEIGMRKPEPGIYQYVLRREAVTPDQTVFFDDSLENVEAARALGIEGVLVTDAATVPAYFS
ncbi:glucose-1-phosphatase [Chimaeribacter arupi]|uniref:Glucose-1-phosphatase n=2 Tax=Yersiniaceae TaxID=1903411 RepID=A0A2N5ELA8_9GAMM|nr:MULTISPECIES: glucose-1-phosphatase [Yersiniaceae]MBS0971194.1 glucose-1-phosphatase [Nissabacter archeti]MDV5141847.1 glucose-1-phosphatase [Chimaeribacter arupi]PLR30214.1 glucose-1-phosphatase [Chimaeribacter arupi]PLR42845.1 glucose-1-phosphatase [Chimaeribacter arupi]PLR44294.1 glucose-1-phosphatase [Chimaeribacter arupi]